MQQWTWRTRAPSTPWSAPQWPGFNLLFRQLQTLAAGLLGRTLGHRLIPDGATTPSVTAVGGITTANTSATAVTALAGGAAGQVLVVLIGDAHTTFQTSATLRLAGAVDWVAKAGETRQFWTPDAVTWHEVG